ncbi:MAG: hypothetical protein IKO72_12395 [Kiritimatiellae bacterium]|nr:hypothetical protein [Kiritimatiellia bacterium]
MKYDLRIENRHMLDVLVPGVDERELCDTINAWCGDGTVVVVTPHQNHEDEKEGGAE